MELPEKEPDVRHALRSFGDDPLAYYREHYAELTRGQLQKKDQSLYKRLRRDGLLEGVPTKNRMLEDALAYYREHYAELTRGQLQKKDPGLYHRLRRDGLLEEIPLKR